MDAASKARLCLADQSFFCFWLWEIPIAYALAQSFGLGEKTGSHDRPRA